MRGEQGLQVFTGKRGLIADQKQNCGKLRVSFCGCLQAAVDGAGHALLPDGVVKDSGGSESCACFNGIGICSQDDNHWIKAGGERKAESAFEHRFVGILWQTDKLLGVAEPT